MNADTGISVRTAGGLTYTAYVRAYVVEYIGQGTAGGALVSQANLDNALMDGAVQEQQGRDGLGGGEDTPLFPPR